MGLVLGLSTSEIQEISAIATAVAAVIAALALRTTAKAADATAEAATASARAATAAERQLRAQTLPLIVPIPIPRGGYLEQPERVVLPDGERELAQSGLVLMSAGESGLAFCSVPIENIGSGVARVIAAYVEVADASRDHRLGSGFDEGAALYVRPGAQERISVSASNEEERRILARAVLNESCRLRVQFEDFGGGQRAELNAEIGVFPREVNSWRVVNSRHTPLPTGATGSA
jgi:hypothetical protein